MALYNKKIMKHFLEPSNIGFMENPDGTGEEGSDACGNIMKVFIKAEKEKISDVKAQVFGCTCAVACISSVTEMIKGRSLKEAAGIGAEEISLYLDGLPEDKMHCAVSAEKAVKKAIEDYYEKNGELI